MQKILVAGAGALGLYYGGRLARAGHPVAFWARGANLARLGAAGLTVRSTAGDFHLPVPLTVDSAEAAAAAGPYDLILVTTKGYHGNPDFYASLAPALAESGVALTLQNGVESAKPLVAALGRRVLAGVAFIGAERTAPGMVNHTAAGHVVLGEPGGGSSKRAQAVAALLQGAGIKATASQDIRVDQWRKLVWNAPFNGITALTRVYAHETLAVPAGRALVEAAMREVAAVAGALGVALEPTVVADTLRLTETAGPVRTSMLVDLEHGRALEIEALYGPPIREGERLGVATPVLRSLAALLALAERQSKPPDA